MRRAMTVLVTSLLTTGGLVTPAPPASADITAEHLTITVTGLCPSTGPESSAPIRTSPPA
jgi:hypothetical protein